MAHKRCVRLHAEYKPMLSVLNVVLDLSDCFVSSHGAEADAEPCYVDVDEDSITYRSATSQAVFHLKDLRLFPASCRGLRWCAPAELHLSLQAKSCHGKESVGVHCDNGIITFTEEERCLNNQDILVEKIKECQNRCYCAGCGRSIFTSKGVFKRVLPLPSENWSDFADIWFCHNHSHQTGSQCQDASAASPASSPLMQQSHEASAAQPKTLSHRPGDCLVSTLYLLVDSSQVCRTTVGITPQTQRLVCMRCGNFVGFVKKKDSKSSCEVKDSSGSSGGDVYKIYLHAIKFLSPETSTSGHHNNLGLPLDRMPQGQSDSVSGGLVEDFLHQLFRDRSRLFTSFRFIVQSSHEEHSDCVPIVLLVWLLDQNLEVFTSDCQVSTASTAPCKSSRAKEEVTVTHVSKLLYKGSFLGSKDAKRTGSQGSIFKMWERDNTVHGLDLPYPLCKQLLSLLILSTKQLPLSQRSLNSFHVGYLHCRQTSQVSAE